MPADVVTLVPGLAPAAPIMRLLSRFDRTKIEAFAEVSIALLDLIDGDPDLEDDDPAGQMTEDEISAYPVHGDGPGCGLSDGGEEEVAL